MKSIPRESAPSWTPKRIFEALDHQVIGQEKAKRAVAIAAYNHLKRLHTAPVSALAEKNKKADLLRKSNMLLIGPTGCGKTHIARVLSRILEVPLVIVDATEYTEAGYYGKDVEVMVSELLQRSHMDVGRAQRGIIFIDEIDKIARASHGARTGSADRDIGGEGVQQALLKILEGREVFVPLNPAQAWNKQEYITVDTANILFICAGTFSDLHHYVRQKRGVGFSEKSAPKGRKKERITVRNLNKFGMLEELLGRLPVVVELQELNRDELFHVLKDTPDSLVLEFQQLLALDQVKLSFSEAALYQVVDFAIDRGLGARGLRSIMEEIMHDALFSAPEQRGQNIHIDTDWVSERLSHLEEDP